MTDTTFTATLINQVLASNPTPVTPAAPPQIPTIPGRLMKLPEAVPAGQAKRRLIQPPFKLHLETLSDAHLRLSHTVVFVGATPYYVHDVYQGSGDFLLTMETWEGKVYRIWYSNPHLDLRNPEPQYIMYQEKPGLLYRRPTRQQRQGLSHDNAFVKHVGGRRYRPENIHEVLRGLQETGVCMWDAKYWELMQKLRAFSALRLSPSIAVYLEGPQLKTEYKGRLLGDLNEDVVSVTEEDFNRPWIKRAVSVVGCNLRKD